jgi:hypothetical protein
MSNNENFDDNSYISVDDDDQYSSPQKEYEYYEQV